ncbi:sporulation protein YpjB [Paenibacillus sp. PAMC21692]|uniref:sporulation protein YpjB n=1 Tax=Paenibacillus sp. PAMC21692 TaxID=2762320 RepID=UPI00164D8F52|nr:sporulation protein YpjB [Paenibacillus sp. PAMC21692]QNK55340.1 hypothetical protein H7F31_22340 [Paenibacillus sp. PAMC21692]
MRIRVAVPFIICIFMTIGSASVVWGGAGATSQALSLFSGKPYDSLYRMDEIGIALYNAAINNNRQSAYMQVQKLQKGMSNKLLLSYGYAEGWNAVAADLTAIETALSRSAPGNEWRELAVKVRLSLDAVVSGNGSLWLQYDYLLREDVALIGQALKRSTNDTKAAANAAGALLETMRMHVFRMDAAAAISGHSMRTQELIQRMDYVDKRINALKTDRGSSAATSLRNALESLDGAVAVLDNIFRKETGDMPALAPATAVYPLRWAFFMGTMISAVLTYVGWRKYRQMPYGVKSIK